MFGIFAMQCILLDMHQLIQRSNILGSLDYVKTVEQSLSPESLGNLKLQVPGLEFHLPDRLCSSEPVPGPPRPSFDSQSLPFCLVSLLVW